MFGNSCKGCDLKLRGKVHNQEKMAKAEQRQSDLLNHLCASWVRSAGSVKSWAWCLGEYRY